MALDSLFVAAHRERPMNKYHDETGAIQIVRIDQYEASQARALHDLLQCAYRDEAATIGLSDFPPLSRTIEAIGLSDNDFFGCWGSEGLRAAIEVAPAMTEGIAIHSLVVVPAYHRRSYATQLIRYVIELYPDSTLSVQTAAANLPALNLYQKFGFRVVREWNSREGIALTALTRPSR